MSGIINLVQNDTGPDIEVTVFDATSNAPVDFSDAGDVVRLIFAREDGVGTPVTITGTKPGGGSDGRAVFEWSAGNLATPGSYEGEVQITFVSGKVQTVPEKLRFHVRAEIT